jgi:hypothetical protein
MKKTSDSVPALESSFSIGNGLSLKGWLSISWFLFIGHKGIEHKADIKD